jgi:hypothetical protein
MLGALRNLRNVGIRECKRYKKDNVNVNVSETGYAHARVFERSAEVISAL